MRKKSKVAETTEIEFVTNLNDLSPEGRQEIEDFSKKHGVKTIDHSDVMAAAPNLADHGERAQELIQAAVMTKKFLKDDDKVPAMRKKRREVLAVASDIARFASIDGAKDNTVCAYFDINDEKLPRLDSDLEELQANMTATSQPFVQAGRPAPNGVHGFESTPFIEARNDVMITRKANNPEQFEQIIKAFDAHLCSDEVQKLHEKAISGIKINHDISDKTVSAEENPIGKRARALACFACLCGVKVASDKNASLDDIDTADIAERSNIEVDLTALREHEPLSGMEVLQYAHTMNIITGDFETGEMWLRSDPEQTPLNTYPDGTVIKTNSLVYSARDNTAAFTWASNPEKLQQINDESNAVFRHETMPTTGRQEDWTIAEYQASLPPKATTFCKTNTRR